MWIGFFFDLDREKNINMYCEYVVLVLEVFGFNFWFV